MEVQVEHLGGVQFEVKARQHTIACDQPESLGGYDEGMTPPELLLASLGSCAAFYAAAYLKKKGFTQTGLAWKFRRTRFHTQRGSTTSASGSSRRWSSRTNTGTA